MVDSPNMSNAKWEDVTFNSYVMDVCDGWKIDRVKPAESVIRTFDCHQFLLAQFFDL